MEMRFLALIVRSDLVPKGRGHEPCARFPSKLARTSERQPLVAAESHRGYNTTMSSKTLDEHIELTPGTAGGRPRLRRGAPGAHTVSA